ncbi:UNVERIFIED_CONTAM: hypothetical protein Slati_0497900 [Sesamum latifolium]|uniref:Uncharacterized protein n=1 Tax=Sesamum latifolium TaxID=2727402 RepID=A0AAW2XXH1_9LAMI
MGAKARVGRGVGTISSTPMASGRGATPATHCHGEDSVVVLDKDEDSEEPVASRRTRDRGLDNVRTESLARR